MTKLIDSVRSCDWIPAFPDLQIQYVVERLFRAQTRTPANNRRKDKRVAFPHLLTLTPIDENEVRTVGEPVTVVGKYLASRGLDFYHADSLPYKRAVVSFEQAAADGIHLVLNISWCRFLRPTWYDSGGRFTHIVQPAVGSIAKPRG